MRIELGLARAVKTKDTKLALIRKADTQATSRHGISGQAHRYGGGRKAVSMPRLSCQDDKTDDSR